MSATTSTFDPMPWMALAIGEANSALNQGEIPVGAVIVKDNRLIGVGRNLVEANKDASAHAEMIALRVAGKSILNWRLSGAKLIVTLEPCPMCTSALMLSRIDEIYYGTSDPRLGACGSLFDLAGSSQLPHQIKVFSGILEKECKDLLDTFFENVRRGGRVAEGA